MTDREVMKLVLEKCEWGFMEDAANILRQALAQPEQKPVEWDDDEWVKKAMEMSRDFVERAKARQQPPPTDTITMAELRKTDLYRKVQTQLLRDILRSKNT